MAFYMGIDAGGTKTFALVGDEQGHVLGFGRGGTGNYEGHGVPAARKEIQAAVDGALQSAGLTLDQISGVGMGIAGADVPEDYVMLEEEIFTPILGAIPRVFRNDSMGGLRGGTKEPFGIVIACGTGCVCAGVNRTGHETRVGGISEEFGDKVSGTGIGKLGLRVVWRERDGIVPHTLLTDLFLERSGCKDVDAFFYKMYRNEMTFADLEPMAPMVFEAAAQGDAEACAILEESGVYLGEMVCAAARKLDMCQDTFDVVMAGSVFKGTSPVLADAMRTRIHRECPRARTVMPIFEPVVGTLLLGMELDCKITDEVYARLSASLEAAETKYGTRFKAE